MPFPSSAVPPGFDVSVWAEGVQSGREPVLRSLFVDANATAGDVLVLAKEWDDDVGDGWGDDDVGDHRRCSSSRAVAAVAARVAAIAFACCLEHSWIDSIVVVGASGKYKVTISVKCGVRVASYVLYELC